MALTKKRVLWYILGGLNLGFSTLGLYYCALTLRRWRVPVVPVAEQNAVIVMTFLNMILLVLVLIAGILLLKHDARAPRMTILVLSAEIFYALAVFAYSMMPFGRSVSAAFGAGNVGIGPQLLTAYPLWALILLHLSRRRTATSNLERSES